MSPFCGWNSTVSRLQNHYKETVYLLLFSFQEFLVLNRSTSEGWKAELTLEQPSGFEPGTPGLGTTALTTEQTALSFLGNTNMFATSYSSPLACLHVLYSLHVYLLLVPYCREGELNSIFGRNFTTQFTLFGTTFIGVWPKKKTIFKDLVKFHQPIRDIGPPDYY